MHHNYKSTIDYLFVYSIYDFHSNITFGLIMTFDSASVKKSSDFEALYF